VCTHNSARSQLAAALWRDRTGGQADSAGTHPAERVHPGAIAAARRVGLDISDARPRLLESSRDRGLVVTVCDRAHEELAVEPSWWHWSVPDPVDSATDAAFDAALHDLDARIRAIAPNGDEQDRP
jgi:ArsR family transcriptional regulator, arsenate/arsenite/antimonite-responsive transcriptional repressor / arsenate reductase (thioredoxin)